MPGSIFRRVLTVALVVAGLAGALVAPPAAGGGSTTAVVIELTDPGPGAVAALPGEGVEITAVLPGLGLVAANVTEDGRGALLRSDLVRAVRAPRSFSFQLDSSTPIIGAPALHAAGRTGAGKVVAVLDSGVDATHPDLLGAVVGEACFLDGIGPDDGSPVELCGNTTDVTSRVGPGSAIPCATLPEDCSHGTHIAGVISGDDETFTGVAPDAGILAIRVNAVLDTGPHIPEFGVLRALEHVYDLRNTYDIVAVNLSFGDPPDGCVAPAWEDVIGRLTGVGIAVVAAAGNSADPTEITFPACLRDVISVGASTDEGEVADFSQSGPLLDLLAPGADITSTVPTAVDPDGYGTKAGTSFAAPHVAAAFALVDGIRPYFTVARTRSLMRTTGALVTRPTAAPDDRDPRYPELRLEPILDFEPFSDADYGFWVAASDWARYTGVSTGPGGGVFDPYATLTRAQAVTFLWRLMGEPAAAGPSGFVDVPAGSWFTPAVDWAAEAGVTTGVAPGRFGPDLPVTRAQAATFLWRGAGSPGATAPPVFVDLVAGSYYELAVAWMAEQELTTGTTPTTFSPDDVVTRAQMVTFVHRLAGTAAAWTGGVDPPELVLF